MHIMRLKFGDRRNDWKCCFCCHVRTGTIFLGVMHLLFHALIMISLFIFLQHPEYLVDEQILNNPVLPTPLSEIEKPGTIDILVFNDSEEDYRLHSPLRHNHYYQPQDLLNQRNITYQDLNVGILVTFCTASITMLMVYGAIKGKPCYLMPYFCIQVFDFCITSLSAARYLCYLPNVHRLISESPRMPFHKTLLEFNPQCLAFIVLICFMIAMMVKIYFIGIVWSCYKYLTLRLAASQRIIHYIDPDSQSLLPDLPDYETAIADPHFAKKFPSPPPSYDIATAIPPTTIENTVTPPEPTPAPAPVSLPNPEPTTPEASSDTPVNSLILSSDHLRASVV